MLAVSIPGLIALPMSLFTGLTRVTPSPHKLLRTQVTYPELNCFHELMTADSAAVSSLQSAPQSIQFCFISFVCVYNALMIHESCGVSETVIIIMDHQCTLKRRLYKTWIRKRIIVWCSQFCDERKARRNVKMEGATDREDD